jgi:phage I-like protein
MKKGIALCAAISIGETGEQAPEWLHLLPAGELVRTVDGRGPYRVADAAALMSASMAGGKLALDENHATDRAAPVGGASPARGWIVDMQRRDDGIWGKVDWVADPNGVPAWKQYRGVSPVINHDPSGTVSAILRASLTNTPNLAGLQSLHSQENADMDFRTLLIGLLGLDSDADDAAITAAIDAAKKKGGDDTVALQAQLSPIARAVGLAAGADAAAVLAGVQQLKADAGDNGVITALQSELAEMAGKLTALTDNSTRKDATTFVDSAIAAGRVGVKPLRDRYITMHMADAKGTEELVNALPAIKGGATLTGDPVRGADGLGAADKTVIALMGLDPKAYAETHSEQRTEAL